MGEVSCVGARPGKAGDGHSTSLLEVAQLLNGRPAESYTQVTFKRQELAKSVGKKFTWLHPISADSLLVLDRVVSNRNEISGAGGKQAQIVSSQLRHPSSDLGKGLQLGVGAGWN